MGSGENAMNDHDIIPEKSAPDIETGRPAGPSRPPGARDDSSRTRHRFVGALCVLAVAVLLWELGDDAPPPSPDANEQVHAGFPADDFVKMEQQPDRLQENDPVVFAPDSAADSAADNPSPKPDAADNPGTDGRGTGEVPEAGGQPDGEQAERVVDDSGTASESGTVPDSDSVAAVDDSGTAVDDSESVGDSNSDSDSVVDDSGTAMVSDSSASGGDFVQVGAFRDSDGAEQLARWLRGDGFGARVESGGDGFHRVFSNADRRHLTALGYLQDDDASTKPSPFVVQLGAFSDESRAKKMAAELREKEFAARVEPVERGGERLFRVRVVGLADRDAAEAARRRLAAMGYDDARAMDAR